MANCLQFTKEIDLQPANSGVSRTRAMVSELLAIKLLREYTLRELIDALSYDFYPLQGQTPPTSSGTLFGPGLDTTQTQAGKPFPGIAARISCLEIAIRAQAKRFLAHPVVVRQLEAIWAGTIVFHSAADNLHRQPSKRQQGIYSRRYDRISNPNIYDIPSGTDHRRVSESTMLTLRRSVSLYDPRDASLFKLSRLRVPRYRQFLSTLSFAILLGLFLAVIQERSLSLTLLEVVFWFWSAGFMLDEIVGFNEQGFGLYLMSFWNTFDVGILILLFCYYCLRIYGVIVPASRKVEVATLAYDVLAANAVLLLPRLFSILDHYRYFSQLLIAFRMMAADLIAVFVLIVIACSGFFVTFTFSSTGGDSPGSVVYALFQMLMGFSPAAWQLWDQSHALGRAILTLFLFVCHFLVVTILITVLTNSFMAIVQNANEEHQFVFAVNTISMVKSDALFSYVAPTNVLAWLIAPLRFVMPFRKFIKINRTVIKVTHLPILFSIYFYERTILNANSFEPTDLVERYGPPHFGQRQSNPENRNNPGAVRPKTNRFVREPSIATHQKDQALEEVFRRPFNTTSYRGSQRSPRRRGSANVVSNWMQDIEHDDHIHPPEEQNQQVVERLEAPRFNKPRFHRHGDLTGNLRYFTETTRSAASDPEDFLDSDIYRPGPTVMASNPSVSRSKRRSSRQTDIDGDDELTSSDNGHDDHSATETVSESGLQSNDGNVLSSTTINWGSATPRFTPSRPSTARLLSRKNSPARRPRTPQRRHIREPSGATVLYNPIGTRIPTGPLSNSSYYTDPESFDFERRSPQARRNRNSRDMMHSRPQPIALSRSQYMSVPDTPGHWRKQSPPEHRRHSFFAMDLGSDLGDNKAVAGGFAGAMPGSLVTQMGYAAGGFKPPNQRNGDNQDMLSKLVLARMKTLEEGFQEVIKEVKDLRRDGDGRARIKPDDYRKTNREKKGKKEFQRRRQSFRRSKPNSDFGSPDIKAGKAKLEAEDDIPPITSGSV